MRTRSRIVKKLQLSKKQTQQVKHCQNKELRKI